MTTRDELVSRLRKAVRVGMDYAGTTAAKAAVKVRPQDWHAICDAAAAAASALEARDAEIARLKAGWNDCVSDLTAAQKRISDLERQFAAETERCGSIGDQLDGGLKLLLAAVHADDPKREILVRIGDLLRDAAAIRGGAK